MNKQEPNLKKHLNKQQQTFSFNPQINIVEEAKWLPAKTTFEATNSVFNITHESNRFAITIEGHWSSRGGAETIHKLKKVT